MTPDTNLSLIAAGCSIDRVNSEFYGRFPYPQPPLIFTYLEDQDFERVMLNQDIGDYGHLRVPRTPKIWVAGCGTNQAVITALRFPLATIIASDLSKESLATARANAQAVGAKGLELKIESINNAGYESEFDYVVCTGVIHHNANPEGTLARLAAALRPTGILELMVYNWYHWGPPACFQQAMQLLWGADSVDFESKLRIARRLAAGLSDKTSVGKYALQFSNTSDEVFADALLQPVLHGYTVESLAAMASRCGLMMRSQCVNVWDRAYQTISWETQFEDEELQRRYDTLPDRDRWQVTNLLTRDKAPYLWFYFEKAGEKELTVDAAKTICNRFLDSTFRPASTTMRRYSRLPDGSLSLAPASFAYPPRASNGTLERILEAVNGRSPMKDIFNRLGISTDFQSANSLRVRLATSAFPYLRAVGTE